MCLDECPPADTPPDYLREAVAPHHPLGRALPGRPSPAGPGPVRHRAGRHRPGAAAPNAPRRWPSSTFPATPWAASASARRRRRWSPALGPTAALLPADKPRYLMGVGRPQDILAAVALRHRYVRLRAADAQWPQCLGLHRRRADCGCATPVTSEIPAPLESGCPCYTCRHFSRAYLHHLFLADEMLGPTLLSLHNVAFYCRLMRKCARRSQRDGWPSSGGQPCPLGRIALR